MKQSERNVHLLAEIASLQKRAKELEAENKILHNRLKHQRPQENPAPLITHTADPVGLDEKTNKPEKHEENVLEETVERYRALSDAAFEAVFISENGYCIDTNRAAVEMFGYTYEELIGIFGTDVIALESKEKVRQNMLSGVEHPYEVVAERKDGTRFHVQIRGKMIEYLGRSVRVTVVNDIDQFKKAAAALRQSEKQFRTLIERAPDAFFAHDLTGKLLQVNQKACDSLGYERHELLNLSVFDIDKIIAPAEAVSLWKKIAADDEIVTFEGVHLRKNGTAFPIDVRISSFQKKENIVIFGFARDMTRHKQMEKALLENELRYRTLFQESPVSLWEKDYSVIKRYIDELDLSGVDDLNGYFLNRPGMVKNLANCLKIVNINKATLKLFQAETRQELAESLPIIVSENSYRHFIKLLCAIAEGKKNFFLERPGKTLRGNDIYIQLHWRVAPGYEDTYSKVLISVVDITKLKNYEKQLRHARKMEAIGTLSGGIAHEFNNILAIILGNSELALEEVPDSEPLKEKIASIYDASLRGKDVVQQLLNFSRQSEEQCISLDIATAVRNSLLYIKAIIPKHIDFNSFFPRQPLYITGNSSQIHQVIINLFKNAIDAIQSDSGKITIRINTARLRKGSSALDNNMKSGNYVCIEVKDSGHGIPQEAANRIYEPFFTTKEVGKGTGMGLAVVHGIIKRHKGSIRTESKIGKGTKVKLYFPVSETPPAHPPPEASRPEGGNESILFVDDETAILKINRQRLTISGYRVTTFSDPLQALGAFREKPDRFDLLVTDMMMPKMNGRTLINEMQKIRQNLPVILCTGHSEWVPSARKKGGDLPVLLRKPVERAELEKTVRSVLDKIKKEHIAPKNKI